jgi:ribonuclease HI
VWKLYFDGASSKDGSRVGIVMISPTKEKILLSYKLEFEATNNVVEYEALVLGLEASRKMNITQLQCLETLS